MNCAIKINRYHSKSVTLIPSNHQSHFSKSLSIWKLFIIIMILVHSYHSSSLSFLFIYLYLVRMINPFLIFWIFLASFIKRFLIVGCCKKILIVYHCDLLFFNSVYLSLFVIYLAVFKTCLVDYFLLYLASHF